MCLAVPLEITELNGNDAIGMRAGISRKIRVDLINQPKVGDFVIVHAGFAIERLTKEQAEENMAAAREVEQVLSEMYAEDAMRQNVSGTGRA